MPPRLTRLTVHVSCATREEETKEAWRAMDDVKAEDFKKNSIFANWAFHGGEIIKTGYNIIRAGTCDVGVYMLGLADTSSIVWLVRPSRAQDMAQGPCHPPRRCSTPNQPGKLSPSHRPTSLTSICPARRPRRKPISRGYRSARPVARKAQPERRIPHNDVA